VTLTAATAVVKTSDSMKVCTDPEPDINLYPDMQTETYRDVCINLELPDACKKEIKATLYKFCEVFSDVSTVINMGEHHIQLTTSEPIHSKPYSLPYALRKEVDREIN